MGGDATLYSWVVVHRSAQPALQEHLPYTVAVVALAEDPEVRFVGRLVELDDPGRLRIGVPVEVLFVDDHLGPSRPYWRLK
jgi:uncharacterized protein